ncbi:MAG: cbb3-type cytochrome oxidase assembly protein CcoS [Gemmatimonadetes bacterium]|nr:cbb3-type cytochrome oxidase assembly protein CcoS [Gemmatimonadota bacterium]
MSVLYVLIPVALVMVVVFVGAYAWSSKNGQFDDLTTPAMRILHEDPVPPAAHSGSPPRRSPPGAVPPPSAG